MTTLVQFGRNSSTKEAGRHKDYLLYGIQGIFFAFLGGDGVINPREHFLTGDKVTNRG